MRRFTVNHKWLGLGGVALLVMGWQILATLIRTPLLFPGPEAAGVRMAELVVTGDFWHHLGATLLRGLGGFGFAFTCGVVVGFFVGRFDWLSELLHPAVVMVRSTPSMTLIILALIWFKGDLVPLFVVFLVVFPLVVENTETGIRGVEAELLDMLKVYRVRKWRQFWNFYLPSVLPFLAAAAATGLGMTWKALIAAEVLASPAWGIGARLDSARVYLQTDQVFAWTFLVVLIGYGFDYILDRWLRKPFLKWKVENHD